MDRDGLARAGIQLPVLPTVVLGGLPGAPEWASQLARIGIDVVCSGANPDSDATLLAARESVPYRPLKAIGGATLPIGAWLVEGVGAAFDVLTIDPAEVVFAVDGDAADVDPNLIAGELLATVRTNPARWWVAAHELEGGTPQQAAAILANLVEAVSMVRLYLTKQQFET